MINEEDGMPTHTMTALINNFIPTFVVDEVFATLWKLKIVGISIESAYEDNGYVWVRR